MQASTHSDMIIYEMPLNDSIRICLRFENLLSQLNNNITAKNETQSRAAITALLKLLDVLHRPDLKSKLTQTLTQHTTNLAQLKHFPQVDTDRLDKLLEQLDGHISHLHNSRTRIAERLCRNEFLNQIRMQLNNPAGITKYKSPAFALWLHQPQSAREADLQAWADEFNELNSIVELILNLTRDSTTPQTIHCTDGFYQQALDATIQCQMIQVAVPSNSRLFPEISAGKHRLSVRFKRPDFQETGRAEQARENIKFELNCCGM